MSAGLSVCSVMMRMMHILSQERGTEVVTEDKVPGGRDPSCPSVPVSQVSSLSLNKIFPFSLAVCISISIPRTVGACRRFLEINAGTSSSTKLNGRSFRNIMFRAGGVQLNQSPFLLLGGILLEPVLLSCWC